MHVTHEDMGSFEFFLRAFGIRPVPFLARETDIASLDPAEADLVLILGGPMGVYEADTFAHLHHEIRFAERRIAAGKPTLGICLGSQIIAKALGANVYKGPRGKEVGWFDVKVTEEGQHTPVRYFDKSSGPVMQWHGDTFDLPAGAKRLVTSDKYENQGFSFEDNTLALQFHPEVTELKLERWYASGKCDMNECSTCPDTIRADAHKYGDTLRQRNRLFFTEWLSQVTPHLTDKHPRLENADLVDA
ncbi:MAG: glutamine amidotransferase [Alphaproteobacteria bacterium]|nr:glutamine amidotransferase [Alphaproteobacteria bacterium]